MESPDSPWAKRDDGRIRKRFADRPSNSAQFFMEFLQSRGIRSGRMIDIGCGAGRNAIFFARSGFEVHAVDRSDDVLKDIDLHGVMPHCHSVTDSWLFDDCFFELAMDILCYGGEDNEKHKVAYRRELMRVLKKGGYFLLSVPASMRASKIEDDFPGFSLCASESGEDSILGRPVRTLDLILQKK